MRSTTLHAAEVIAFLEVHEDNLEAVTMETHAEKEARWKREDKIAKYGASVGDPCATLCLNCYGRHLSPRDHECPHPKLESAKRR